ncbi:NAD(P)H quinone oxidoreductase [Frondihabitans sucicola]|uniref:NAD(P)H quinone oxidoreductase n=1 Tax=Frondihabitans sucicola TaxID=1268041 RepID=A0ABM8GIR6_9MICO|nr:NAD(P)H quinone oxidoreductase [Frondihabitans sucicola]
MLVPGEAPEPVAGPGEVVIEVAAAGLNRADIGQRQGSYPPPAGTVEWPGMEVSGTIAAVGPEAGAGGAGGSRAGGSGGGGGGGSAASGGGEVGAGNSGWKPGDRVCALLPGGGYAERVAIDAGLVLPVPDGVDLVDAAGLPEVAATVWSNVYVNAGLKPGETLLVHGGTSGIGTFAIQLAVALGSRVIATAGTDDKVAFCESLGASSLNYHQDDFVETVHDLTDGHGADVILDLVGGDYLARNVRALAVDGRIMVIANQSGQASSFELGALMQKRGRIWGTTLRPRPLPEKRAIIAGVREHVWPLLEAGTVRPVIDRVFPLDEAAAAHRWMEDGGHIGKILLRV